MSRFSSVVTKSTRDEDPEAGCFELCPEVKMGQHLVAVDHRQECACGESTEDRFVTDAGGERDEAEQEHKGAVNANFCCCVLHTDENHSEAPQQVGGMHHRY